MKIFFTAILSFLLLMTTAEAAKVDAYRNMISSGRFTIKYTLTEPPIRKTNKEAKLTDMGGFGGDFKMTDSGVAQRQSLDNYKGVMVFDGANKCIDSLDIVPNIITTILKTNGETFRFCALQKDDKKEYYASSFFRGKFHGRNNVFANEEEDLGIMNAGDVMNEDYSYGILTTALAPMISTDKVIATHYTPEYKFIGSGTLNGGLSYEDFFGSKNGFNCAIRYYFDGDTLSKIAVFDYVMKDSRVQTYEKYLVQIDEFSATPDQSYLSLPEGLKDKTKRDKGAKK